MVTLARLRRPLRVLGEGVALVLAAVAATLVVFPTPGRLAARTAITGPTAWNHWHSQPRFLTFWSGSVRRAAGAAPRQTSRTWGEKWPGLNVWSSRRTAGGRTARHSAATVSIWFLLGTGLAGGAGRLLWERSRQANGVRTGPSTPRRIAVGVARVWLWSAAALGAALIAAPYLDVTGWPAGLWVELGQATPFGERLRPQLFYGADVIGERGVPPWRWVLAVPVAGTVAVVGRFIGSPGDVFGSPGAGAREESGAHTDADAFTNTEG